MQIAKWGNSLAVRLPRRLVRELGLREGDQVSVTGDSEVLKVARLRRPDEILADIRKFRGRLSSENRLSRDEAHER